MSEEKEIGKIYETKNYDKFIKKEWNRDINQNNINKIDKSVKENGWLITPIIVNENYEIIEGQHRYYYAKQNNLVIYLLLFSSSKNLMDSLKISIGSFSGSFFGSFSVSFPALELLKIFLK